ncbi:MAG: hypothetical protein M8860_05830 [marine benthic group bacterium]|nr:hypothetical protein [Candidatus Carthagonibacter metallireducens]
MNDGDSRSDLDPPQLHIFDAAAREVELGSLVDGEDSWQLWVIVERTSTDLCRGRISFRSDEERYDTDAILVEESERDVLDRAQDLPASMLRQLLLSIREGDK